MSESPLDCQFKRFSARVNLGSSCDTTVLKRRSYKRTAEHGHGRRHPREGVSCGKSYPCLAKKCRRQSREEWKNRSESAFGNWTNSRHKSLSWGFGGVFPRS